jgi:CheY-like chemotaxis protein
MASILLVEDEVLIRMMIAEMLSELQHSVVAETGSLNEALELAANADFELAILDVNLGGDSSEPVARLLDARKKSFVLATGYGARAMLGLFRDRPLLTKPFQIEALQSCLDGFKR